MKGNQAPSPSLSSNDFFSQTFLTYWDEPVNPHLSSPSSSSVSVFKEYLHCSLCVCTLKARSKTWNDRSWFGFRTNLFFHRIRPASPTGRLNALPVLCSIDIEVPRTRDCPQASRSLALPGACNSYISHLLSLRHWKSTCYNAKVTWEGKQIKSSAQMS